jgi:hypothetical protein
MRLRFWKRPRYFDFSPKRTPKVVLCDFISAIAVAIGEALVYLFGTEVVIGGVAVFQTLGYIIAYAAVYAVSMALSMLTNSLMTK